MRLLTGNGGDLVPAPASTPGASTEAPRFLKIALADLRVRIWRSGVDQIAAIALAANPALIHTSDTQEPSQVFRPWQW